MISFIRFYKNGNEDRVLILMLGRSSAGSTAYIPPGTTIFVPVLNKKGNRVIP